MLKARYRDGKITAEDGESVEIDDLARRHELAHRRRLRAGIDDDLKILARELRGAPHMVPVGAGSPVINKGLDFIDGDFEPEDGWRALARKICDD